MEIWMFGGKFWLGSAYETPRVTQAYAMSTSSCKTRSVIKCAQFIALIQKPGKRFGADVR
jgi:hypothetical protein